MGKIVEFEQGSEDWVAWRRLHIGGSDANLIAAYFLPDDVDYPYTTTWAGAELYRLWCEKTNRIPIKMPKDRSHDGYVDPLVHGHKTEILARNWYNAMFGQAIEPVCVEHWTSPYVAASLDGLREGECIVEIKCPKEPDMHRKAKEGEVPAQYWAQLHHNMCAAGETKAEFVSFYKGEGIVIPVETDKKSLDKLMTAEDIFWSWMTEKKFGGLPISGESNNVTQEWQALIAQYFINQGNMRALEAQQRKLKRDIHSLMKTTKVVGGGARVNIAVRPQSIVPAQTRNEFLMLTIEK